MALNQTRTALLGLAVLAGCGEGRPSGTITVSAALDRARPEFATVRIGGLGPRALRRAAGASGSEVAVFATADSVAPGTAPMAGTWSREGLTLAFRPRFAPSAGLSLWIRIDTAALGGRPSGAPPLLNRFTVPPDPPRPPTILTAIHPTADSVPENLLRIYLEFSAPMRPGQALAHLRLLDDCGDEVSKAFLDVRDELWDPTGRRLTVLFDPGRVKRGIRTNRESGRPLVAGRRYSIRILPGWPDAHGVPLARGAEKRFVAVAADMTGPNPSSWAVTAPRGGTVEALEVRFGEALDHALARRLLAVEDEAGLPVDGVTVLEPGDRVWRFTPATPWHAGRHRLVVSPELEDPAGNRPGHAFDTDLSTSASPEVSSKDPIVRWFIPRS